MAFDKPTLVVLACMTIGLALGSPAIAGTIDELFEYLDSDGDGVITRAEFQTNLFEVFFERDSSENIKIELSETKLKPDVFAAADTDGDGSLSGVEFNDAAFTQFEAADTNTDGVISREEFERFTRQFIDD
ncbi:MAG: EF-hand domain-containing protein [Geminicoccaceae bacterium]